MNILQKDDTIIESLSETQCFDFLCSLLKPLGLTLVIGKTHHYMHIASLANKLTIFKCQLNDGFLLFGAPSAKEYFRFVLNDVIWFEPPLNAGTAFSRSNVIYNPYIGYGFASIDEMNIIKDLYCGYC